MSHNPASFRLMSDSDPAFADAIEMAPRFEATTNGIAVSVRTFWLEDQSQPDDHHYVWAYHIRIENGTEDTVQLLSRSWTITDGYGKSEHIHGNGVIGEQPVLVPGEIFEYTSGTMLKTSCGFMKGCFHMIVPSSALRFEVEIPAFSLDNPHRYGLLH